MQNYAIQVYFDRANHDLITQVWGALKDTNLSHEMFDGVYLPHFTLMIGAVADITKLETALAEYAHQSPPFVISFAYLGVFPTNPSVVFLGLTVTSQLLDYHQAFHQRFASYFTEQRAHYLPGHWVPHCTVGFKLAPEIVPDVVAVAQQKSAPLINQPIRVEKIGIVEVPKSIECFTFEFKG